jgi:hypothetical protein
MHGLGEGKPQFVETKDNTCYLAIKHKGKPKLYDIHKYVNNHDIAHLRNTEIRFGKGKAAQMYETYTDDPRAKLNKYQNVNCPGSTGKGEVITYSKMRIGK